MDDATTMKTASIHIRVSCLIISMSLSWLVWDMILGDRCGRRYDSLGRMSMRRKSEGQTGLVRFTTHVVGDGGRDTKTVMEPKLPTLVKFIRLQ
jgi:hypothetical protein